MSKFRFKTDLELDIENTKYSIDLSDEDINKSIVQYVANIVALSKTDTTNEDLQLETICKDFLVSVLGKENVEKIFSNKIVDKVDIADLCNYILAEITEFKKNKFARYS